MCNFGNRCGHDPRAPQLRPIHCPQEGKGGLPPLLRLAVAALVEYYEKPNLLPTLNNANGKSSQQRSERREALIRILSAIIHRMDIASLRVGVPRSDGSFYDYSIAELAEAAGLEFKRAQRAISDLKTAGLINIKQIKQRTADGACRSFVAIKTITRSLFALLGLGAMFSKEHEKRAKKQRKSQRAQAQESIAAKSLLQRCSQGLALQIPRRHEPEIDENRRRQEAIMIGETKIKHPHWSHDQILDHVKKELDARGV